MLRILTIAAVLALAPCLAGGTARAQRADGGGHEADRRQRALDLLDESAVLYREGQFGLAAERLRRAHDLHPDPSLLYNLGRALDAAGEPAEAADAYARYLDAEPESPRRGEVEARIARLRGEAGAQGGTEGALEGDEGEAVDGELSTEEPDPEPLGPRAGPSLLAPGLVLAAGGAALATGLVFGVLAKERQDDAREPDISHQDFVRLDDEAHDLATVANVLFVAGGVTAAVGLTWLLLAGGGDRDGSPAEGAARLGLEIDAIELGPGSVALRGHF